MGNIEKNMGKEREMDTNVLKTFIAVCEYSGFSAAAKEVTDLSNIILETIASLNEINPLTGRLIQIARDGKISDDEMKDFAYISKKLDEISLAIDSLNLWVDKTAGEQGLNLELLNAEKEKLK